MSDQELINQIFPAIPPASFEAPARWPGHTAASAEKVVELLKVNHVKYHTYFDPRGFHNHVSHYLLALYGLGAHPETIEAANVHETSYQAPAIVPPGPIDPKNFTEHTGDDKYYESYRQYFASLITRPNGGMNLVLEFVINKTGNFNETYDGDSPNQRELLNRLLDGLLHPMIHIGYGVEFGLPGLVVEGLAAAAIHRGENASLFPPSFWDRENNGFVKNGAHAFTILSQVINDPQFGEGGSPRLPKDYPKTVKDYGSAISDYVKQWGFDAEKEGEVQRKVEELVWCNVLIYGVGGWKGPKEDLMADFYRMHLVTSSLFLNTISAQLKPQTAEFFLRGYFAVSLAWLIHRGRKPLDIAGFMSADTAYPVPSSGTASSVRPNAVPSPTSIQASTPNPWFPLISTALTLPEDHLVKLYRALSHFGSAYGDRKAGYFAGTELKGAEKLDGTLFIRVAGLTEERIRKSPTINQEKVFFWDGTPPPPVIKRV